MPGQGSAGQTGSGGRGLGGRFIKALHTPESPFGGARPEHGGWERWEVEGQQRPRAEPPLGRRDGCRVCGGGCSPGACRGVGGQDGCGLETVHVDTA